MAQISTCKFPLRYSYSVTKLYTCTCKGKGIVCLKAKWPSGEHLSTVSVELSD